MLLETRHSFGSRRFMRFDALRCLFGCLCLTASALLLMAAGARAQEAPKQRLALVIGNSAYGSVSSLDNPTSDANLISDRLKSLAFDVTLLTDASQIQMKRAIAQFGRELRKAGPTATGLFYYAGHGVQSYGTNYLLPVDVSLLDAADLDLVAVEAQSVLRQMFSAKNQTNIVILDACRNNPFTDIPEFNDSGLAEMDAPRGTFLAYATSPGGVALDGLQGNSPFTKSIAGYMASPGLPIEQMFKQVRIEVLDETDGAQTPWDSSSLTSNFMFAAPPPDPVAADEGEEEQWRQAQASSDPIDLMLFLRTYPASVHRVEARNLLAAVMEYELGIKLASAQPQAAEGGVSVIEERVFQAARTDKTGNSYQVYLRAFPAGVFADLARQEMAAARQNRSTDPVGEGVTVARTEPDIQAAPLPPVDPDQIVTFIEPLTSPVPEVSGKSIAILMNASPLYPPVADLPDSYWKNQTCGSCHKWSEDRLCDHATSYLSRNMERSLSKPHPFGGALKHNLRAWAAGGCQ